MVLEACRAGGCIKPGARAPGTKAHPDIQARECGRQRIATILIICGKQLSPIVMGSQFELTSILGLAPQALCFRLLRRLRSDICAIRWNSELGVAADGSETGPVIRVGVFFVGHYFLLCATQCLGGGAVVLPAEAVKQDHQLRRCL